MQIQAALEWVRWKTFCDLGAESTLVFWVSQTPPEAYVKICSPWLWPRWDTAGHRTLPQRTKTIIFPVRQKTTWKSHTRTQYNYHVLAPSTALESGIPAPGKHFKKCLLRADKVLLPVITLSWTFWNYFQIY